MTLLQKYMEDPEAAKLVIQGELIMEVTETICELLEKEGVSRKELADRLGKSKGFISQLLNGGRNLTLRTVADILHVLGYKVTLSPYKETTQRQFHITEGLTTHIFHKNPEVTSETFEFTFADSYQDMEAIVG